LKGLVDEIKNGVTPMVVGATPGGFSTKLEACKKFSRRDSQNRKSFDPAAVYTNDMYHMRERYPNMTEVCYTKEWLSEHPDVVDTMQTLECFIKQPLEDKISSCMCYHSECEIVFPGTKKLEYGGYITYEGKKRDWGGGDINVFISDEELDDLNYTGDLHMSYRYNLPLAELKTPMEVVEGKVEEMVPKDLEVDKINIFVCNSTLDMDNDKCFLHKTIYQSERRKRGQ
jgi:hypothetical protein